MARIDLKPICIIKARHTWLSSASMINIKKKQMDQNGAPGILATAAGYAMNAKPGPDQTPAQYSTEYVTVSRNMSLTYISTVLHCL